MPASHGANGFMHYIVGSGPAGIACAHALVAANCEVTILGAGLQLEPERRAALNALAASPPSTWSSTAASFLRQQPSKKSSPSPRKLSFGSDFPYRQPPTSTHIRSQGVDLRPSYAAGGYSTVWDAAILPWRDYDLAGWPIAVRDLEAGYRAVLQWMPCAASQDGLAQLFPLYRDSTAALPASLPAASLLRHLQDHHEALRLRGLHSGAARLAVREGCVQCGLCSFGCPRQLIWSSDQALAALLATGRVHYRPGVTVHAVRESGGSVEITGLDESTRRVTFVGRRVFLAAGVLGTTTILLRSLRMLDTPVRIRDSQLFRVPLFRLRSTPRFDHEPRHTLAQLFLEILDESISPYTIHLQAYTWDELFRQPGFDPLGIFASLLPAQALRSRLLLLQGYLHSAHSPSISATLESNGAGDTLRLRAIFNPESERRARKVAWKLARLARRLGAVAAVPLLRTGPPGFGYSSGGSFPMSAHPRPGETDTLGRPWEQQRIHAVDATVLPTIPATPITLGVMANAWRIGTLAAAEESPPA